MQADVQYVRGVWDIFSGLPTRDRDASLRYYPEWRAVSLPLSTDRYY